MLLYFYFFFFSEEINNIKSYFNFNSQKMKAQNARSFSFVVVVVDFKFGNIDQEIALFFYSNFFFMAIRKR